MIEHPKFRAELLRLLHPVENQTLGHDHQRWPVLNASLSHLAFPADQPRENLDRFAQTHVVGQASTQTHPFEKRQPAQALALVVPQRALKTLRFVLRLGTLSSGEFGADFFKSFVHMRLRLTGEQGIQESDLNAPVAQPAVMFLCERHHRFQLGRKALRQDAE